MIYILLPAYNEYQNIRKIFLEINKEKFLRKKITVILINDGSNDNSKEYSKYKSKNFKFIYIEHTRNLGLNMSLKTGLETVSKKANDEDIVITLDCDNTHPISYIKKLIKKIKNFDVVIASRFTKNSKVVGLSVLRNILSLLGKVIFKKLIPIPNVNDYTCNFRAYKFKTLKKIIKTKNIFDKKGFGIAAELLIKIHIYYPKTKFIEIPFSLFYNRKIGLSKMNVVSTIFKTIKLILVNKKLKKTFKPQPHFLS